MAQQIIVIDNVTGTKQLQDLPSVAGRPFEGEVDVGVGGADEFQLPASTFVADSIIWLFINLSGPYREGLSHDFTRDVANQKILMNWSVTEGNYVRIAVFK